MIPWWGSGAPIQPISVEKSLAEIQRLLLSINRRGTIMSAELDALTAQVAETNGVIASAVTLIHGLRQQIIDAGTDPAKLAELAASLDASEQALAAAVSTNP